MISIFTGAIAIPPTLGQLAVVEKSMHLKGKVRKAWVALSGYRAEYVGQDNYVKLLKVNTKVRIEQDSQIAMVGADVIVTGQLHLHDIGNNNTYNGSIYYTLFVDYTPNNGAVGQ